MADMTHNGQSVSPDIRRKVLITGAAGKIGWRFAESIRDRHDLTLLVLDETQAMRVSHLGKTVIADITDLDALRTHFAGQDTIVHLAANASPETIWDKVLRNNIIGTYNVMTAARDAGCRRVVFASSIHAVAAYPRGRQVRPEDPVNPHNLYGVSKCFGEALGQCLVNEGGPSVIAVRIGGAGEFEQTKGDEPVKRRMVYFVSYRDLNQLLDRCISNTTVRFAIVHGISNNRFNKMDVTQTCDLLGYEPQDDLAEAWLQELRKT